MSRRVRGWAAVAVAVARRPVLWPVVLRQARRLARPGWWRTRPFLPVPDRAYVRFRVLTSAGDPDAVPAPSEVVAWLDWSRSR